MSPALLVVLAALVIVALWYFTRSRERMLDGLTAGVKLVQAGVFARLKQRYAQRFPPETAGYLAGAVVNALFSRPPVGEAAEAFRVRNEALIAKEFAALKSDPELCQTVWQAVIAMCMVTHETTPKSSRDLMTSYRPRQALEDSGLVPDTNHLIRMDFLDMAVSFAKQNKATRA